MWLSMKSAANSKTGTKTEEMTFATCRRIEITPRTHEDGNRTTIIAVASKDSMNQQAIQIS